MHVGPNKHLMYIQNEGNVLFLSVGPVQGNLHRLLGETLLGLAEEMHLHLVVKDWEGGNKSRVLHIPAFLISLLKKAT